MSTRLILGAAGAAVGFYVGGPQGAAWGWQIGYGVGTIVDPDQIEGPRLNDARTQTSRDGVPIPIVFGVGRVAGNIIWTGDLREIRKKESGKGGPEVTTFTYLRTHAIGICRGPILGIRRIWRDQKLVYDATAPSDLPNPPPVTGNPVQDALLQAQYNAVVSGVFAARLTIYLGGEDQMPDPEIEAVLGAGNVPAYRGLAHVVIKDDDLTDRAGAIPQYEFEVITAGTTEALPPQIELEDGVVAGSSGAIIGYFENAQPRAMYPLMSVIAENRRGPGLGDSDTFVRIQYFAGAVDGYLLFDSGWMGDPLQIFELNERLTLLSKPLATQVNPDVVEAVVTSPFPSGMGNVRIMAVLGGNDARTGLFNARSTYRFMPDGLVPEPFTFLPEATGVLVGADGQIYPTELATASGDTLVAGTVTLGSIIGGLLDSVGVDASRRNIGGASTPVKGYTIARHTDAQQALQGLQQAFQFDAGEWDGKIQFVPRGGAIKKTLSLADLCEVDGPALLETRAQEVELPRKLSVTYADPTLNYTPSKQTAERYTATASVTEGQIEIPVVLDSDEAAKVADILLKASWNDLQGGVEFTLPDQFSDLTPTDAIELPIGPKTQRVRIDEIGRAAGRLKVVGRIDRTGSYVSTATGTPPGGTNQGLTGLRGPTTLAILDVAQLRDQDDSLGYYIALNGPLPSWTGAIVQVSYDDGETWEDIGSFSQEATMGTTLTELQQASPFVRDTRNTVRVQVDGVLASITEGALLREGNQAFIGDELVQFQTATLVSPGVYDLSGLVRGRLGTSSAFAAPVGSRFVLLDAFAWVPLPVGQVGRLIQIRAVSVGTAEAAAPVLSTLFLPPASQTEFEVAALSARRTGSDLAVRWSPRGRLGVDANPATGPNLTGYRVALSGPSGGRSYTTTQPELVVSSADLAAVGASAAGSATVEVAAVNAITGPGPYRSTTA